MLDRLELSDVQRSLAIQVVPDELQRLDRDRLGLWTQRVPVPDGIWVRIQEHWETVRSRLRLAKEALRRRVLQHAALVPRDEETA